MKKCLGLELIDAYGLVVYKGVDNLPELNMNYYYKKKVFLNTYLHIFNYMYNEFCMVSSITKKIAEEFYMVTSITKKTIYSY